MVQRWQWLVAVLAVVLVGAWSPEAKAQRNTAQVPVQVGVGPAANFLAGPTYANESVGWGGRLSQNRPFHTGLRIGVTAVIKSELVRRHPGLVPNQYRRQIVNAGEVRYAPGIISLIPKTIYLSPPIGVAGWDDQSYGATWSLIGVGLPLISNPFRFSVHGSLIGTALYINSEAVGGHYFFARPGAELKVDLEIPLSEDFLVSLGWSSMFHIPQSLDEGIAAPSGIDENSLWHIGQFYVQGHFRIPYSYRYR